MICNCNSCKNTERERAERLRISKLWAEAGKMASVLKQIALIGEPGVSDLAKCAVDGWNEFMGIKKAKRVRRRK